MASSYRWRDDTTAPLGTRKCRGEVGVIDEVIGRVDMSGTRSTLKMGKMGKIQCQHAHSSLFSGSLAGVDRQTNRAGQGFGRDPDEMQ